MESAVALHIESMERLYRECADPSLVGVSIFAWRPPRLGRFATAHMRLRVVSARVQPGTLLAVDILARLGILIAKSLHRPVPNTLACGDLSANQASYWIFFESVSICVLGPNFRLVKLVLR